MEFYILTQVKEIRASSDETIICLNVEFILYVVINTYTPIGDVKDLHTVVGNIKLLWTKRSIAEIGTIVWNDQFYYI